MTPIEQAAQAPAPQERSQPKTAMPLRERRARIRVLQKALIACYEIIDKCRKELAELEAAK